MDSGGDIGESVVALITLTRLFPSSVGYIVLNVLLLLLL